MTPSGKPDIPEGGGACSILIIDKTDCYNYANYKSE